MALPRTTLEQWVVLQTVIEQGSYAQAAEVLNRSQSSVSYALSGLQERLGLPLLEIHGRKATLTEQGRALLMQATPLISAFLQLEHRAAGLKDGTRTELSLVVDSVFPKYRLFRALKNFQQQFPDTRVHLTEILRGESLKQLNERSADLYITTLAPENAIQGRFLLDVDFVPVAKSDHPLMSLTVPLTAQDLARFPLISVADRHAPRAENVSSGPVASWTFTTVGAAMEAIAVGVGYGWLPLESVEKALESGLLRRLELSARTVRQTALYMVMDNESERFDKTVSTLAKSILTECGLLP
ncbi:MULTISPECIES: LysR family transcriptional regulator [Rahnella]|jgi:DNA-binding transcriptional LysR family regulator|uniref:LysR family transcriptional regulator n=1 Tax=Rahnella sp. (strain Y9602) TaxID=2703885 RepID=A0ABW6CII3_RAHSY|nr:MULTISPECIES: LysR family transcriptional regulator [Rahnella]AYA06852.1 LysR family transcriptional regulator [Rahnella aquatilis]AZP50785.1 LysR family transcriptional regulator [Rahnella aquatilis]MDP9706736.1 DNA-binding transcriptional LysR family regulator [Rahnella aquatilis]MQB53815.1 LysR family transcriptional regulator [Rahnella sp. RcJ3]NIA87535.1 LysR family transcriptional regulator [Rahnella aceris]